MLFKRRNTEGGDGSANKEDSNSCEFGASSKNIHENINKRD